MTLPNPSEQAGPTTESFAKAFKQAEDAIKRAGPIVVIKPEVEGESSVRGPFVPAVNQLRLAGSCISDYFTEQDSNRRLEHLHRALSLCKEAEYSAYGCMIQLFLDQCRLFQEDYECISISPVINDYTNKIKRLEEIKLEEAELKLVTPGESGEESLEKKRQHLEDLAGIYKDFQASREELNKLVERELKRELELAESERREKRNFGLTVLSLIVSVLLLILSVFLLILTFFR